jgi:hypothetical protein
VHIQVARGQKWLALPEDLRRRICVELVEQRADAAWLAVLEDMHAQGPGEFRLTAVAAKTLCDHREYVRAFAVIKHATAVCAELTFAKDPEGLVKELEPFAEQMARL